MKRIGSWKAFGGTPVSESLKDAKSCYMESVEINCWYSDGDVIPLFMRPAGVRKDWLDEINARASGTWRQ